MEIPKPIKQGKIEYGEDGSSWLNWWLFGPLTDEQIENFCNENGIHSSYRGAGRFFSNGREVIRGSGYTKIQQRCGYDI
jgi:hypothetical protein